MGLGAKRTRMGSVTRCASSGSRQSAGEAAPGFEPGVVDLQSTALPLGYAAGWPRSALPNRSRVADYTAPCGAINCAGRATAALFAAVLLALPSCVSTPKLAPPRAVAVTTLPLQPAIAEILPDGEETIYEVEVRHPLGRRGDLPRRARRGRPACPCCGSRARRRRARGSPRSSRSADVTRSYVDRDDAPAFELLLDHGREGRPADPHRQLRPRDGPRVRGVLSAEVPHDAGDQRPGDPRPGLGDHADPRDRLRAASPTSCGSTSSREPTST